MAKTKTALDKAYDSYKALTRYYAKKSGTGYQYLTKQEYSDARPFLSQKDLSISSVMSEERRGLFNDALTDMLMDDKFNEDKDIISNLLDKKIWNNKDHDKFFELVKKYDLNLKQLYYAE